MVTTDRWKTSRKGSSLCLVGERSGSTGKKLGENSYMKFGRVVDLVAEILDRTHLR